MASCNLWAVEKLNIGPAKPGKKDNMKLTKLLEVKQTNCAAGDNAQPEWNVIFEADGKTFQLDRLVQWNRPELHHVQQQADQHGDFFWMHWAKPIVLA